MSRESASVVIVGGGIVGSSIAYHLSARGCTDVVVVEKAGAEASGSTARSAAGVRHQFATEVNIRLSLYSIERLKHFEEEVGGYSGLKQIGYLLLVSEPEIWKQYQKNVALQQSLGVATRLLTPKEAADLLPSGNFEDLLGATLCPHDGHCDPYGVAVGYLNAARRAGVDVRRSTRVIGIHRDDRRVIAVETTRGSIACDTVINAAGPWAGQVGALAGLKIPVLPFRRCVYLTEPVTLPPFPFVIDTASGFYMRPEGEKLLIGVTNEAEPSSESVAVDWEWLETVLELGAQRFPFIAETGIIRRNCWAGLYENTPDHCPILGRHPDLENYIDASGFSGHGVMHSPATGMLIAEEVLDGRAHSIDIDDLRIGRFASAPATIETNVY